MTSKTKYTTKAKYQNNIVAGTAIPIVGLKRDKDFDEVSVTQQRARKMLMTVRGTEDLVERIIQMLDM